MLNMNELDEDEKLEELEKERLTDQDLELLIRIENLEKQVAVLKSTVYRLVEDDLG